MGTLAGNVIDLTLAIQIGATAAVVMAYAVFTSLGEQRAAHQSRCYMILLASFVCRHHPQKKTVNDVLAPAQREPPTKYSDLEYFNRDFTKYKEDGTFPSLDNMARTSLWEQIVLLVSSPIAAISFPFFLRDTSRGGAYLLVATEYRKNIFSKVALLAVGSFGYLFFGLALASPSQGAGLVMMIFFCMSILSSLISMVILTAEQSGWKTYWSDTLVEIMASEDKKEAHDEFNRAMLLLNSITEQPDVPFPGRLGLYTGVYSAIQGMIFLISK